MIEAPLSLPEFDIIHRFNNPANVSILLTTEKKVKDSIQPELTSCLVKTGYYCPCRRVINTHHMLRSLKIVPCF